MSDVNVDIKQLLQLIYLDVYEGISPFIHYTKADQGLNIRSVKIRAGNIPFDENGKINVNNEVLKDPLLAATNAWQVEMVFGDDITDKTEGIYDLTVSELFGLDTKSPETYFYEYPISILQNAGDKITGWLSMQGIINIGQLCQMSDQNFMKLIKGKRESNLIELRTKARLLEVSVPVIPQKGAEHVSLYNLVRMSESEFLTLYPAGTINAMECRSLLNYLGLLSTCLNDSFLKRKTLAWLRK